MTDSVMGTKPDDTAPRQERKSTLFEKLATFIVCAVMLIGAGFYYGGPLYIEYDNGRTNDALIKLEPAAMDLARDDTAQMTDRCRLLLGELAYPLAIVGHELYTFNMPSPNIALTVGNGQMEKNDAEKLLGNRRETYRAAGCSMQVSSDLFHKMQVMPLPALLAYTAVAR